MDLPGPGGGEMNYPLLISEIRKLNRPLPCIIEHIQAEPAEMTKTKGVGRESASRQPVVTENSRADSSQDAHPRLISGSAVTGSPWASLPDDALRPALWAGFGP